MTDVDFAPLLLFVLRVGWVWKQHIWSHSVDAGINLSKADGGKCAVSFGQFERARLAREFDPFVRRKMKPLCMHLVN